VETAVLQEAKAPEGSGMGKCKPDITIELRDGWHSVICINTSRVRTHLIFRQGKLDKVEQTEVIPMPK